MKLRSTRGEVVTAALVLYVLVGLGLGALGLKVSGVHLFQKAPPTKELQVAQDNLDKAKKDAADAEAKLKAAIDQAQAQTKIQVQGGQEYVEGARSSLKDAPVSPEVTLAKGLLDRASLSLNNAIGDLPADRRAEIIKIVEGALSEKQEEVDQAMEQLAERDAQNATLQLQKLEVEAKIPALEKQAAVAETKVNTIQEVVTAKTNEVVAYANTAAAEKKQAGSLQAFADKVIKGLIGASVIALILGVLYLWRLFRSVTPKTLGNIVGDIRSGVAPTQAFDTNLPPSLHPAVKKQADAVVSTPTP